MIYLKELQLKNFLSHKNTVLAFKPEQRLCVSGVSGSGKSSVVEAITWVLYGIGRSDNYSLIKKGTSSAEVSLMLSDEDKDIQYKITRTISKSKHELTINEIMGKEEHPIKTKGIKETQEYIEKQILRSSYELFVNSIVHLQNEEESFVTQPAPKRKEILLEIIRSSDYDEYLKKAKDKYQELKIENSVIDATIKTKLVTINQNQESANKYPQLTILLTNAKSKYDYEDNTYQQLIHKSKETNELLTKLLTQEEKRKGIEQNIEYKTKELNTKKQSIEELKKIDINSLKENVSLLQINRNILLDLQKEKNKILEWKEQMNKLIMQAPPQIDYDTPIDGLNKKMIGLIKEKGEICPALNKVCPIWEEKKNKYIKEVENDLRNQQEFKKNQEETRKQHIEAVEKLGPAPTYDATSEIKITETVNRLEHYEKDLTIAETQLSIIGKTEKEIQEIDQQIINLKTSLNEYLVDEKTIAETRLLSQQYENETTVQYQKINKLNQEISDIKSTISLSESSIKIITDTKEEIKQLEEKLKSYQADTECLEILKEAFGSNGIKAIVIDYILPDIEEKTNNILQKLSDFRVKFDTQKSGIGKDVVIEGLFITIINEIGEEMAYENYSGGEKVKISMAIQESLASISNIGFRILDETIVALDNDSIEKFLLALEEILSRVKQVVCISHIPEIKSIFEEKIEIKKINGNSQIIK